MTFFNELSNNNNKEWFHANKQRYENDVNQPFTQFVEDLLKKIKYFDKRIAIGAADAIFRINRDIRFSRDKTPYKLFRSALISSAGRKSKAEPGFYIELGYNYLKLTGGSFKLSPAAYKSLQQQLTVIEQKINTPVYKSRFKTVQLQPGSIIFEANHNAEIIFSEQLLEEVTDYWKTVQPVLKTIKKITG